MTRIWQRGISLLEKRPLVHAADHGSSRRSAGTRAAESTLGEVSARSASNSRMWTILFNRASAPAMADLRAGEGKEPVGPTRLGPSGNVSDSDARRGKPQNTRSRAAGGQCTGFDYMALVDFPGGKTGKECPRTEFRWQIASKATGGMFLKRENADQHNSESRKMEIGGRDSRAVFAGVPSRPPNVGIWIPRDQSDGGPEGRQGVRTRPEILLTAPPPPSARRTSFVFSGRDRPRTKPWPRRLIFYFLGSGGRGLLRLLPLSRIAGGCGDCGRLLLGRKQSQRLAWRRPGFAELSPEWDAELTLAPGPVMIITSESSRTCRARDDRAVCDRWISG